MKTAFYFVAHADDWQLFMNPEIARDIADPGCKVVIVHTTAGDAGREAYFWRAREVAAVKSLTFRLSAGHKPEVEEQAVTLHGKNITRVATGNSVLYFLRLPDGAYYGEGFGRYGGQSLEKLRTGVIDRVQSVDGQSAYAGWASVVETLDGIVQKETQDTEKVLLCYSDPDRVRNLHDHNDHVNTTCLVQDMKAYHTAQRRMYINYEIRSSGDYLQGEDLFWKVGMFAVYHQSILDDCGHSTIEEDPAFFTWSITKSIYTDQNQAS